MSVFKKEHSDGMSVQVQSRNIQHATTSLFEQHRARLDKVGFARRFARSNASLAGLKRASQKLALLAGQPVVQEVGVQPSATTNTTRQPVVAHQGLLRGVYGED